MPTAVRRLPGRLTAPEPGWTTRADVVVVGSGIAGLTAALRLRDRVDKVTRRHEGRARGADATQWAQGGVAAALRPGRWTPEPRTPPTRSVAGAGLPATPSRRATCWWTEGPEAVRIAELIALGVGLRPRRHRTRSR
jgi:L-aspartate oxidase